MSLKKEIYDYLKQSYPNFIHGGEIEKFSISKGRKASNGSRRARELVDSGLIERELRNKEVWYRFKGEESLIVKEMREIREKAEREKELKNYNSTAKLF
jgi:hypothetical protein